MADILIRGIEMPSKGCLRCPFNLYYANAVYCNCMIINLLGKPSEAKYQNEVNCPLVELPEHGDLIDRDYIQRTLKPYSKEDEQVEVTLGTAKRLIQNAINAPVIIPSNKEAQDG